MAIPDVSRRSITELVSLDGRGAVVTGGANGIGLAIASRFAEAGAYVLIGDIDEAAAKQAADRLVQKGYRAIGAKLDAADPTLLEEFAAYATRELGTLDIWVNNAGIYPIQPALEMTETDWDQVMDLNLRGVFFAARAAAKQMQAAHHGGVIINLASTAGYRGYPGLTHYVASKHGVRGITRNLAAELGPMGIRVLAIAPTLIETPGIQVAKEDFKKVGVDDVESMIVATLPLGRTGQPDDIARVALFLASDLAMFMTGSTIPVDGGNLAV